MFGFNGIVKTVNNKEINKMNEKVDIDVATLKEWDKQEKELVTSIVRELSQYLYPTPEVEILDPETAGDQYFKVDIVLHFPECEGEEARSVAFQCKSSKGAADAFTEKYKDGVKYKGQIYPCPGVYWNDTKSISDIYTLEQLEGLGEFLGVVPHPKLTKALELLNNHLARAAKKDGMYKYLDYRHFYKIYDHWTWDALQRFKFISIGGGRIILNL